MSTRHLRRFDVALWRAWPSYGFPVVEVVEAPDAIAAVVQVMRAQKWTRAAHVAAGDLEGALRHRAYGVRLVPLAGEEVEKEGKRVVVQLLLIDNVEVMNKKRV